MRKLFIAGNWKMCKTGAEAAAFVEAFRKLITPAHLDDVDVALCPPFTALSETARALQGSGIGLGAQDMCWEAEGAYTGEISANMLLAAGCRHVVIGHSERRQFFHETDETVNKKLKAAFTTGLHPIMCIGETLQERDQGRTFDVLQRQLTVGLAGFAAPRVASLVIAYEPVWAIGTGRTATPQQADEAHRAIRQWVSRRVSADAAAQVRIQYGGSVKPENATVLLQLPDVDGALVGGASLDPNTFASIIDAGRQVKTVTSHARS